MGVNLHKCKIIMGPETMPTISLINIIECPDSYLTDFNIYCKNPY